MKRNIIIGIVSVVIIIVLGFILLGGKSTAEKITENIELGNKYLSEGKYKEAIISFNKTI